MSGRDVCSGCQFAPCICTYLDKLAEDGSLSTLRAEAVKELQPAVTSPRRLSVSTLLFVAARKLGDKVTMRPNGAAASIMTQARHRSPERKALNPWPFGIYTHGVFLA